MHVIYDLEEDRARRRRVAVGAAKGMKWESPRGPIAIDPETRDIIQTVYIRQLEKIGGKLLNVEIGKVENVKDPVKERMKK